jgi:hypothetical protein
MIGQDARRDLVVLVPDRNIEFAVSGLLTRARALGIREIDFQFYRHDEHDPGCLLHSHDFLKPFANHFEHALVVFDHEGCGREDSSALELEKGVRAQLSMAGWGDRGAAIVIEPELEVWVWSDSPHVARALGWHASTADLRQTLQAGVYWRVGESKPVRPKEAMEHVLREVRRPRSSSIYGELAREVSVNRCADASFARFAATLQKWFPPRK